MLIIKQVSIPPSWSDICQYSSLSHVLETMLDALSCHASIQLHSGMAYIFIKQNDLKQTVYLKVSEQTWQNAHHIVSIQPSGCACWRCIWRRKRQRYLNTAAFDHILQ